MPRKIKLKLSKFKIEQIRHLRKEGTKQADIADLLNISQWSVSKILEEKKLININLYNELMEIKKEKEKEIKK
jgi:predicted transcriptional regulator